MCSLTKNRTYSMNFNGGVLTRSLYTYSSKDPHVSLCKKCLQTIIIISIDSRFTLSAKHDYDQTKKPMVSDSSLSLKGSANSTSAFHNLASELLAKSQSPIGPFPSFTQPRNGKVSGLHIVPSSGNLPVWKYWRMIRPVHKVGLECEQWP